MAQTYTAPLPSTPLKMTKEQPHPQNIVTPKNSPVKIFKRAPGAPEKRGRYSYDIDIFRLNRGDAENPVDTEPFAAISLEGIPDTFQVDVSKLSTAMERVKKSRKTNFKAPQQVPTVTLVIRRNAANRTFVGRSDTFNQVFEAHFHFHQYPFTEEKPLSIHGNDIDDWIRRETLVRMYIESNIEAVRGWKYTDVILSSEQLFDAFDHVCHYFKLCHSCGEDAHAGDKCRGGAPLILCKTGVFHVWAMD